MALPEVVEKWPSLSEIKRIPAFKALKPKQLRMISGLLACDLRVEAAAKRAKIDWRNHYNWMHKEEYKQAVDYAKQILADTLESRMLDDAIAGRVTPIIYKGVITGDYREINASERITLLKGLKPQYRESLSIQQAIAPTAVSITLSHQSPSPDNSLNKLGDTVDDAKIIKPNSDDDKSD